VREGRFLEQDLLAADEVFVMSTVRQVLPVVAVADTTFAVGPVVTALAAGFRDLVAGETGS
jgi:branched-subunit amino acid aminotransferase/4-amino-4-deoxychorismate lyase